MAMLYIHRDDLEGKYPLTPWGVGSESNEHTFGFTRVMVPDFSLLDFLRLVPKIAVRLLAACRQKHMKADFQKTASGYSHFYFSADGIDVLVLLVFPSDDEISVAIKSAYEEALTLWALLGYYSSLAPPQPTSTAQESTAPAPTPLSEDENDPTDEDEVLTVESLDGQQGPDSEDDGGSPSGRPEVEDALESVREFTNNAEIFKSNAAAVALNECSMAVAATNLADLETL
jgi:hypothetical protein